MGVTGLWSILSPIQEHVPIRSLGGQVLAIDLSGWICGDIMLNQRVQTGNKLYIRNMIFRVIALLRESILPVAVTDGTAPELKATTLKDRQQSSKTFVKKPVSRPISLKRSHFARISAQCCRILSALGVPFVASPGEAEAMCAFLDAVNLVDGCVTNDGDAFLYGASMVYRHFTLKPRNASVEAYAATRVNSQLGLCQEALVLLGLVLGCDLWPTGVPKVGPVSAGKLLSEAPVTEILERLTADTDPSPSIPRSSVWTTTLWKKIKTGLASCPVLEILDEYLKPWHDRGWIMPDRSHLKWSRPDVPRAVLLCSEHLDWQPSYALAQFVPILALWNIRNERALGELSADCSCPQEICPIRILRKRSVDYLPCFEVEWSRLEGDIWSMAVVPRCGSPGDLAPPSMTATTNLVNTFFTDSGYRFCVPVSEFRVAYPQMAAAFETVSLNVLTERLDGLTVGALSNLRRHRQRRTATTSTKKAPPTSSSTSNKAGPMDAFMKPTKKSNMNNEENIFPSPWESSPERSPNLSRRFTRPATEDIFSPSPRKSLQEPQTINFISVRINSQFERRLTLESSLLLSPAIQTSSSITTSPPRCTWEEDAEFSAFRTPVRLLDRLL